MLRLTLRSASDGRVSARIVDRDGTVFVLDHGDPAVVADASKLVRHGGFQVQWQGVSETALAGAPGFLQKLALHYVAMGWLVFVDEPDWPRRGGVDPVDVPTPSLDPHATGPTPLASALGSLDHTQSLVLDDPVGPLDLDAETEIVSREDLVHIEARRAPAPYPDPNVDPEAETEERPRPNNPDRR